MEGESAEVRKREGNRVERERCWRDREGGREREGDREGGREREGGRKRVRGREREREIERERAVVREEFMFCCTAQSRTYLYLANQSTLKGVKSTGVGSLSLHTVVYT
jgi:hypothetical protein